MTMDSWQKLLMEVEERRQIKQEFAQQVTVGSEWVNSHGSLYGVVSLDTTGEGKYRVTWYDEQGFVGHSSRDTLQKISDELCSTLGVPPLPAPGSLEEFSTGVEWRNGLIEGAHMLHAEEIFMTELQEKAQSASEEAYTKKTDEAHTTALYCWEDVLKEAEAKGNTAAISNAIVHIKDHEEAVSYYSGRRYQAKLRKLFVEAFRRMAQPAPEEFLDLDAPAELPPRKRYSPSPEEFIQRRDDLIAELYKDLDAAGMLSFDAPFDSLYDGVHRLDEILTGHQMEMDPSGIPTEAPHDWDTRGEFNFLADWTPEVEQLKFHVRWDRNLAGKFTFSVSLSSPKQACRAFMILRARSRIRKKAQEIEQQKQSKKITRQLRDQIAEDLHAAGLDGNGRFEKPAGGLVAASDVLQKYGIEFADLPNSWALERQSEGQTTIRLAWKNPSDPFSPTPIENSMLVLSWYKFRDYVYECLAYLS